MVPGVVGDLLMIPLEFSGLGIERQDRGGIEIVAAPPLGIVVGRRVAGADIDRAGLLVVNARAPGPAAAELDALARPAFLVVLEDVKRPLKLAGKSIYPIDLPSDWRVSASVAGEENVSGELRRD